MKKEKLIDYILHLKNWIPKEITKTTVKELFKKKYVVKFRLTQGTKINFNQLLQKQIDLITMPLLQQETQKKIL